MSQRSAPSAGSGTPISILFQILGIDQAKSQLQTIPQLFTAIQVAAEKAGINLSTLSKDFQQLGTNQTGLNNVATGLAKVSIEEQSTASNTIKLNQALQQQQQASTTTAAAANTLSTATQKTALTEQEQLLASEKLAMGLKGVQTSAVATASTEGQLSSSFQKTAMSMGEGTGAMQNMASGLKTVQSNAQGTIQSEGQLSSAFQKSTVSMGAGVGTMDKANQSSQTLKQSFTQAVLPITMLTASTVSLFQTFEDYNRAVLRNEIAQKRKESADLAVTRSQENYNKAVAKYGPDSQQATDALVKEDIALKGKAIADGKAEITQNALSEATLNFAQNVVPNALSVMASFAQVYGTFSGNIVKFIADQRAQAIATAASKLEMVALKDSQVAAGITTAAMTAESNALTIAQRGAGVAGTIQAAETDAVKLSQVGAIGATAALSTETKVLGVTTTQVSREMALAFIKNPLTLGLTIAGVAIAAFVTNLGGFRDAVNGVGVALAKLLPFLRPVLDMIGGIGQFMVNSLGMGSAAATDFGAKTTEGVGAATGAITASQKSLQQWSLQQTGVFRNASGMIVGFSKDYIANMDKASASNKTISDSATTSMGIVDTAFKRGELAALKLQQALEKVQTVGNLKVGGLSPSFDPKNNMSPINDYAFKKAGQEGMAGKVDAVTSKLYGPGLDVIADDGRIIASKSAVIAKLKELKLTQAEIDSELNILHRDYGIEVADGTLMVGSTQKQIQAKQAEIDKIVADNAALTTNTGVQTANNKAIGDAAPNMNNFLNALGQVIPQQQLATVVTAGMTGAQDMQSKSSEDAAKKFAEYTAILSSSDLAIKQFQNGVDASNAKMREQQAALVFNIAEQITYGQQLKTNEGQQLAFGDGVLKTVTQLNKTTASIYENAGSLTVLQAATRDGSAQTNAMTAAYYAQGIALEEAKIKTGALEGTLKMMKEQYASGSAQIQAYNNAIVEQRLKTEQDRLSVYQLQGTLAGLNEGFSSGILQITAYNKGFLDADVAFVNARVAISTFEGAIGSLATHLRDGTAQELAFTQGVVNERKAMLESVVSLETARGSLLEYAKAYSTGLPQAVAFQNAVTAQTKSFFDYGVALATAEGKLQVMLTDISSNTAAVNQFSTGYVTAATSVTGLIQKLNEESGAIQGTMAATNFLAKQYGVVIPAGLKLTTTQYQDWVKTAIGSRDEITKTFDSVASSGQGMIQKLGDAFRTGGKDLETALKDLATQTGLTFTKDMQDMLKPQIVADSIRPSLQASFNILANADLTSAGAKQMVDQLTQQINENVTKSPGLKAAGDALVKILNDPMRAKDPQQWIKNLQVALDAYGVSANKGAQDASIFNAGIQGAKQPLDGMTGSLNGVNIALDAYIAKVDIMKQKALTLIPSLTGGMEQDPAKLNAIRGQTATTGKVDTSGIDTATTKVTAFKTLVDTIPVTVTKDVDAMNSSFMRIDPVPAIVTTKLSVFTTQLGLLPAGIAQMIGTVNTNFAQFGSTLPVAFSTILKGAGIMFTALLKSSDITAKGIPPQYAAVSTGVNTSFVNILKGAQIAFTALLTAAGLTAKGVPPLFATAAASINANMNTISAAAAKVFAAVSGSARTEVGKIPGIFASAAQSANTSIRSIASTAQSAMNSVISSANAAAAAIARVAAANRAAASSSVSSGRGGGGHPPTGNASGFGPMIVDHPLNMTVGESGPELVEVIPLRTAGDRNLTLAQRLFKNNDIGNMDSNSNSNMFLAKGTKKNTAAGTPDWAFAGGIDPANIDKQYPFVSTEWPPTPRRYTPVMSHRHDADSQRWHPGSNHFESTLQPGDYDFEHFAKYARSHNEEAIDPNEIERRLALPEYRGIHWDRDHDSLLGDVEGATKKYHDRLVQEGVYSVYKMYDGSHYYKPDNWTAPVAGLPGIIGGVSAALPSVPAGYHRNDTPPPAGNQSISQIMNNSSGGGGGYGGGNTNIGGSGFPAYTSGPTGGSGSGDMSGNNFTGHSNTSGSGGGSSGTHPTDILNMIKSAVSGTSVHVQSVSFIDSNKVYENTKMVYAKRAGSFLN